MTKPGVQNPHWEAWQSTIACCSGVQRAVLLARVLDGDQLAAVERADELDAGVDRLVVQATPLARPRQNHCAGATVPLVAAFLAADQTAPPSAGSPAPSWWGPPGSGGAALSFSRKRISPRMVFSFRGRSSSRRAKSAAARGSARRRLGHMPKRIGTFIQEGRRSAALTPRAPRK